MKTSKTKAGIITLLTGCIVPVLIYFYMSLAGLDVSQKVDDISKAELWSFLIVGSILCGFAVAISMGIVSIFGFVYEFLGGKDKRK